MADDPMWALVMFDAPVKSAEQRASATRFRNTLLDYGFSMVQYSVYAKYLPTGVTGVPTLRAIRNRVPYQAKVRILFVSDRQWANMQRFYGEIQEFHAEKPQQLMFF
ncbi:CRISPR-associated endonuclease Cas2 [Trueperella sp. LYQ141]|uniref:CRISPR-associated endonuclease Cas2 n=1 Tax=Trueperella sp. LYQ141 TaxID=3391058 RepID=UPI003983C6C3